MTLFQTIIVPAILLGAFLAFLGVLAVIATRRLCCLLLARQRDAEVRPALLGDLRRQVQRQGDVIAGVIAELDCHPATYESFPQDLRDQIYAAHEGARELERKTRS